VFGLFMVVLLYIYRNMSIMLKNLFFTPSMLKLMVISHQFVSDLSTY